MGHELENANDMVYRGDAPWHRLGKHFDFLPTTVQEILDLIPHMGSDVKLAPLFLDDGTDMPLGKAVLRCSDGKLLGSVGPRWQPIQPRDAFSILQPYLDADAVKVETAGMLRGGSRIWMLAKINKPDCVIIPKADDRVAKYLLVALGHDGSMSLFVVTTAVRVVCANTLAMGLGGESGRLAMRIRHGSGAKAAIEAVRDTIEAMDASFEATAEIYRALAGKEVKTAALRAYVDAVFRLKKETEGKEDFNNLLQRTYTPKVAVSTEGKARFQELLIEGLDKDKRKESSLQDDIARLFEGGRGADLPGVRGTVWGAYNAVAEYLTHERGRSDEARLNSAWFDDRGTGQRALVEARKLLAA